MLNSFKTSLTLFFLVVAVIGKTQTAEEYFEKINENYANLKSFELELNYRLYKGHKGTEIKDEYQSTLRMDGKRSHRKIYHDEVITTDETSLILNHQLRTIQILPGVKNEIFDENISNSLEHCQDVKVNQTKEGTLLSLTFKPYSSLEYSRIDVLVDDNFWVQHITLFCVNQLNYSKDYFNPMYDYPRLEVSYKKITKNWKDNSGLTELSKYVLKEGQRYRPTSLYQNYEIIQ